MANIARPTRSRFRSPSRRVYRRIHCRRPSAWSREEPTHYNARPKRTPVPPAPTLPPDVREAIIAALAAALVRDVEAEDALAPRDSLRYRSATVVAIPRPREGNDEQGQSPTQPQAATPRLARGRRRDQLRRPQ